jgi:uncharacterized membrane protein YkoI
MKAIIIFFFIVLSAAIAQIFFLSAKAEEITTAESIQTTSEIPFWKTKTLEINIDNKTFEVEASNYLPQIFGIQSNIEISFYDAAKIAYENGNLYSIKKIRLEYQNQVSVYIVEGYGKDKFYDLDVDNLRIVTLQANNGNMISIQKELLVFSFVRTIISSMIKSWQR